MQTLIKDEMLRSTRDLLNILTPSQKSEMEELQALLQKLLSASSSNNAKSHSNAIMRKLITLKDNKQHPVIRAWGAETRNSHPLMDHLFSELRPAYLPVIRFLCESCSLNECEIMRVAVANMSAFVALAKKGDEELSCVVDSLALLARRTGLKFIPQRSGNCITFMATRDPSEYTGPPTYDEGFATAIAKEITTLVFLIKSQKRSEQKPQGNIELLVHSLVKIVAGVVNDVGGDVIKELWSHELFGDISSIFREMYMTDPTSVSIKRRLVHPSYMIDSHLLDESWSSILLWFTYLDDVVVNAGLSEKCFSKDYIILLPLISKVMKELGDNPDYMILRDRKRFFKYIVNAFMCVLHSQDLSNHLQILSSNAFVHFVTLFQTNPDEDFNDGHLNADYFVSRWMMPFELFFRFHKNNEVIAGDIQGKIALLPNLLALLSSKRLTKEDLNSIHNPKNTKYSPVTESCYAKEAIMMIILCALTEGPNFYKPLLDTDAVPKILRFFYDSKSIMIKSDYHSLLGSVSGCFLTIASQVPQSHNFSQYTERLYAQMTEICPLILPTLADTPQDRFDSVISLLDILARKDIVNIKSLETSYGMFLAYIKKHFAAKKFNKLADVVEKLSVLTENHGPEILSPYLLDEFPTLWKKTQAASKNKSAKALIRATMKLTFTLVLDVKLNKDSRLVDLEGFMFDWVSTLGDHPINAGGIRVAWHNLKCSPTSRFSQFFIKSIKKRTKTGDVNQPKHMTGLRYLTDTMETYLDMDPPYSMEYVLSLTSCMVQIASSEPSDSELDLLEDLVTPAIWLLQKRDDKKIVENVQRFQGILR